MTVTTHILQRPPQFQFDKDAWPCWTSNCRVTCASMIAGYYQDRHIAPSNMRILMTYTSKCGGTNTTEEITGLKALGIPAVAQRLTPAQVRSVLSHNIPVDLAVNYGRIPRDRRYISDMGFRGAHSVLACKVIYKNGVRGLAIRDPDHGSSARPERPSYVFWPDKVWQAAFLQGQSTGIAVRPKAGKSIPAPAPSGPVVHAFGPGAMVMTAAQWVRATPNATGAHVHLFQKGAKFLANKRTFTGGRYVGPDKKVSTNWFGFSSGGKTVWVPAAYCKNA